MYQANELGDIRKHRVVLILEKTIKMFGLGSNAGGIAFCLTQTAFACFVVLLFTQTVALFMAGDTDKQFECFSVLTFCSMAALKVKSLRSNSMKWKNLLLQLDNLELEQLNFEPSNIDYESDDEDNKKCFVTHINSYTKKFNFLSANIYRVYSFTLFIFIMSPFMECLYWKFKIQNCTYPHVLPSWSPLEAFGFWGYLVTVTAEILAAFYAVAVHVVFDIMLFGLIIFLSGQFTLLREFTEGIGGKGKGYDITVRRDARARFRIERCHRILITLEESVIELEKLVRNILGIYFLVAIFTLCSVAMRLSSEEMSMMKGMSLLQYTSACLIQLFLFCYYGDMLQCKSTVGMGEGVYACAWWRLSPRVRREALLLAFGQARVRRLRAGPFNRLDLPSFIQIVRAAYSYYAVLRK